jgi:hypothetical protein
MSQSDMAEEEDQVLELFDESVSAYKKALELDPGRYITILLLPLC